VVSAAGTLTTSIFDGITSSGKSSAWLVRRPTESPRRWAVTGRVERGAAGAQGFAEAVERDVADGDEIRRAHGAVRA
jgi:hypothetical protein